MKSIAMRQFDDNRLNTVKFISTPFYNSDYQQITLIGGHYDGKKITIKKEDNVYKKQYHNNFYGKLLRKKKPTMLLYKRIQNTSAFLYAGIDGQREKTKLPLFLRPFFLWIFAMLPKRKRMILARI